MIKHLFCLLVVLLPYFSLAQHTVKPNAGARGLATANSNLLHQTVHSLFSNPAGLAQLNSWQATSSVLNRFLLAELKSVSAGFAGPISSGGIGLKLSSYGFQQYKEQQIGFSYGRQLFEDFSIGASFDCWTTRIPEHGRATSLTFELGLQYALSKQINMGIHLYNPIRASIIEGEILPSFIAIGLNYQPADYLIWSMTMEQSSLDGTSLRMGLEYIAQERIFLRCGVQTGPMQWTMGVGYRWKKWTLNIGMGLQQVLGVQSAIGIVYIVA